MVGGCKNEVHCAAAFFGNAVIDLRKRGGTVSPKAPVTERHGAGPKQAPEPNWSNFGCDRESCLASRRSNLAFPLSLTWHHSKRRWRGWLSSHCLDLPSQAYALRLPSRSRRLWKQRLATSGPGASVVGHGSACLSRTHRS